ncbi:GRAS transcription factor [Rhynchospora pubera]|uniref:GRAS transcription factor n=1 Tax=Rhynchospora pubera TaxID=906938 RepID=A0AAV8EKE3_9POAL|nr:GRAS transcription factor [Rhynchospora pubera]
MNQQSSIACDSAKQNNGFVSRQCHTHDSPSWKHPVFDLTSTKSSEIPSVWQFQKGVEESVKFLPNNDKLFLDLEPNKYKLIQETEHSDPSICPKKISNATRSKKKANDSDFNLLDRRRQKQIAVYSDPPDENEVFDAFLLLFGPKSTEEVTTIREILQKEIRYEQSEAKASKKKSIKIDKNQIGKGSVILCSLLVSCSETVFTNNWLAAIELMKEIREWSSPTGDSIQRLAYYFIDGLEARLAGTGSEIYGKLVSKQPKLTDILKACQLYLASCPFERSLFYIANQTIYNIAKDATRVHIITYGVIYGYQWPSFFEHLSDWKRTPPKIRMTVIEEPEPGFRPNKRVEAIGQRLTFFAKRFNVPFEYQGIASKWENVQREDLYIGKDEKVIVCCLVNSSMLPDETTAICSPRDYFLKTVRKIKPHAFIHRIWNASYNTPFFLTRFRLALSHYSCVFDMLDSTLPRNTERVLIETNLFIPNAINSIACEWLERVYRPETYKQWQARHLRAGLEPVPVDSLIMENIKYFVRECYHKNIFIDEDDRWVVMGWKGVILRAMSIWKPNVT